MNPYEEAFIASTELDILDWGTLVADLRSQGIEVPQVEVMIVTKKDMLAKYKQRVEDRERLVREMNLAAIGEEARIMREADAVTTITKEEERRWWERFFNRSDNGE
jgi:hypothetical protein